MVNKPTIVNTFALHTSHSNIYQRHKRKLLKYGGIEKNLMALTDFYDNRMCKSGVLEVV